MGVVGRVIGAGVGVVVAAVMVAACAATAEEETGEAQQAVVIECTNAGGTVAGALSVSFTPQGTFCYRTSAIGSGGQPPPPPQPGTPSCYQLAKQLGCIGF